MSFFDDVKILASGEGINFFLHLPPEKIPIATSFMQSKRATKENPEEGIKPGDVVISTWKDDFDLEPNYEELKPFF